MGTWAGNLMMKYYHKDFPSDIFILLETVGATLAVCESMLTALIIWSLPKHGKT